MKKGDRKSKSLSRLLTDLYIFSSLSLQSIFTTCIALFLLDIQRYVKKQTRKKQWKTEFNTLGVLRTISSFRIPPIVTNVTIKKTEIEVGDKKHKTRQCKSRP